ncbi:acyl-CoA dehydrogenase family protein [Bradyrhizobium manausense]|uniref:acyl-CoA dehydrogenase family protein n=1 Tax=Bradyrhizobium manausense TaxID=989370 RepID=UPI001BABF120|nr:acyl-CoA dehydrogenase family protein [Bradyrhizobium manausense]MBR0725576.1 acyl-CoA dehydrogenase family protein [Bradyrhizobium manausense]
MTYKAPIENMMFALDAIADLTNDCVGGLHSGFSVEDARGVIEEGARFATDVLAPLNRAGDRIGARISNGDVSTVPGWRDAYVAWREAGWNAIELPAEHGGMGLPTRLASVAMEMWTSACMAFALGPVLTQGAVETIEAHASDALKRLWLPKLVSGEWTATMSLTEPGAGSDLGLLRTRAVRNDDGTFLITGAKIFITYGEHDLTDNIVHLVLARCPDAPRGTRGISLFLVPKYLVAADGSLGRRNDIRCTGLERKLGIHASPTCAMSFGDDGGAVGWLIGKENEGLACMFTMMNKARLYTGLQGVAIAERAFQQALTYAKTRRQGRSPNAIEGPSPIIEHPDVRRNLMRMKSLISAGRALAYAAAGAIDRSHHAPDLEAREREKELAGLLTPIVKATCSEIGVEVTSLGVQIHGGMGYMEETGAAQHFRDARITPIYEGTNGIQAIDLVTRKVLRSEGKCVQNLIAHFRAIGEEAAASTNSHIAISGTAVIETINSLARATRWLEEPHRRQDELLAIASPYLKLFGVAAGAALLTKGAIFAAQSIVAGEVKPVHHDALAVAAFYAANIAVEALPLERVVTESLARPMAISEFAL